MTQHPELHVVETVCSTCGTARTIRTAADRISIDTCSSCHPAYTGVARPTVSGNRVERFNRRRSLATL